MNGRPGATIETPWGTVVMLEDGWFLWGDKEAEGYRPKIIEEIQPLCVHRTRKYLAGWVTSMGDGRPDTWQRGWVWAYGWFSGLDDQEGPHFREVRVKVLGALDQMKEDIPWV